MSRTWITMAVAAAALLSPQYGNALSPQSRDSMDRGRVLAQRMCSECHAVQPGQVVSPNPFAPSFEHIANTRGMTSAALWSWLHSSHRNMPNIILHPDETRAIVSYILTLQDVD